jgi:DNA sulfur modification protein DndD
MNDLIENLRPIAVERLEDLVSKHFLSIADSRFKGRICFPMDSPPVFEWRNGKTQQLDTMSGFERRSFGIAFSLALAEITQKRVPLIIDTPLGNADSEYRPRLLKALTDVDLDQIIILTHDQEVNGDILNSIECQVSQKFLVSYDQNANLSEVYEDQYFGGLR